MDQGPGGRVRGQPGKFLEGLVDKLIAHAEWTFRRRRQTSDGATEGDHVDAAARIRSRMGGKVAALHAAPPAPALPPAGRHVWMWFHEIISGEPAGYGPATVTWVGLKAWIELSRTRVEPWEARALVRLGILRANIISEDTRGGQDKGTDNR